MGHKSRSLLVVLSIAVGVATVGMINNAKSKIERDLFGPYGAGNPTRVQIYVSPFDQDLVSAVQAMPEVETGRSAPRVDGDRLSTERPFPRHYPERGGRFQ